MRIIAGNHKGLTLRVPRGSKVRPTPQRVRESLFSILGERVVGARVLDLFAGSGSLGLECLSRGARSAVFVERDRDVASVLRENLRAFKAGDEARLLLRDVPRALRELSRDAERFDLVVMDPPYSRGLVEPTVEAVDAAGLLAPGGLIVVDHPAGEPPPAQIGSLVLVDRRVFGDTAVALFAAAEPLPEGSRSAHMDRVAIYPGSFDPVTHGHLNIIDRALQVFDRLVVGVLDNATKTALFSVEERIAQIREATGADPRVEAVHFAGLLVDFAKVNGATVIVRGLRAVSDFDYEFQMAHMNRRLCPEIETMFMMTGEEYFYVSSRLVKEVVSLGGDVTGLVPPNVVGALAGRFPHRP